MNSAIQIFENFFTFKYENNLLILLMLFKTSNISLLYASFCIVNFLLNINKMILQLMRS